MDKCKLCEMAAVHKCNECGGMICVQHASYEEYEWLEGFFEVFDCVGVKEKGYFCVDCKKSKDSCCWTYYCCIFAVLAVLGVVALMMKASGGR